jgi:HPt (histidine-containing phosphotransfer) domain-containing protein
MVSRVPVDELKLLQLEYLLDIQEKIEQVRQHARALERKNSFRTSFPVLLYLAHQMKGSGGSLGFDEISRIAAMMSSSLNRYLDDSTPRPKGAELASDVLRLAGELGSAAESAEQSLRGGVTARR